MNNELTESERALNCIIENYVNELQRNTCDDDEEDMRIYKEKIEFIENLKERILKDLETLDILKPYLKEVIKINKNKGYLSIRFKLIEYGTLEVDGIKNEVADRINIIKRWLDNGL